eukprot:TRINITY_DN10916_c0_g1_i3.p1 TRINITY_DN10916_c0_g1~~TRINITY_DN10916_c0_g1_i3.p1  ORF type:complete len:614 (+),score=105.71 TRINITY_DN10916_c0_g1_i3:85-1926(+)
MLLGCVHIATPFVLWTEIQRCIFERITLYERIGVACILGFVTSAWTVLWYVSLFGTRTGLSVTEHHIMVSILLHIGFLYLVHRFHPRGFLYRRLFDPSSSSVQSPSQLVDNREEMREAKREMKASWEWAQHREILLLFPAIVWIWYIYSCHTIPTDENGNILTVGKSYEQLPYHLTIIHSFLHGYNSQHFSMFTMSNPILYNDRLLSPIIPDFVSVLLVRAGFSLRMALLVPSFIMVAAFCLLLYSLAKRFAGLAESGVVHQPSGITWSSVSACMAVYIMLLCGGGFDFGKSPSFWLYFVQDMLVPNRNIVFAYVAVLGFLCYAWEGYNETSISSVRWKYLQMASFVAATTPFLQGHAFVSCTILAISSLFIQRFNLEDPLDMLFFQDMTYLFGPAVFLGLPQMAAFIDGSAIWGFVVRCSMWSEDKDGRFLYWLWECIGFHVATLILTWRFFSHEQRNRFYPFLVLFFVASLFKFQPVHVDNMKILYVAFIGFAVSISYGLVALLRQQPKNQVVAFLAFASMTIPGLFSFLNAASDPVVLLTQPEMNAASWVMKNTNYDSLFMLASPPPRHKNPVTMWAGRNVVMGHKPWIFQRGLPYDLPERVSLLLPVDF